MTALRDAATADLPIAPLADASGYMEAPEAGTGTQGRGGQETGPLDRDSGLNWNVRAPLAFWGVRKRWAPRHTGRRRAVGDVLAGT